MSFEEKYLESLKLFVEAPSRLDQSDIDRSIIDKAIIDTNNKLGALDVRSDDPGVRAQIADLRARQAELKKKRELERSRARDRKEIDEIDPADVEPQAQGEPSKVQSIIHQNTPAPNDDDDDDYDISDLVVDTEDDDDDLPPRYHHTIGYTTDSTGRRIPKKIQTGLGAFTAKRLQHSLNNSYDMRNDPNGGSLLIYGEPGIGKSQVVQQFVMNKAKNSGKTFVDFDKLELNDVQDIINNPENYFLYVDQRASGMLPFEAKGIPDIQDTTKDYSVKKQEMWIYLLTLKGIDGVLFLDELGHAPPDVANTLFGMVLNKKAGENVFSDGVFVVAASNFPGEMDPASGSSRLPIPLLDRMNVAVLIADPEAWYEWAGKNNVDPLIISFVQHNPDEHFYVKPDPDADDLTQSVTPRSIVSFDRQLKKMKTKLSVEKKEAKRRGVRDYLFLYLIE